MSADDGPPKIIVILGAPSTSSPLSALLVRVPRKPKGAVFAIFDEPTGPNLKEATVPSVSTVAVSGTAAAALSSSQRGTRWFDDAAAAALSAWVRRGGRLVLVADGAGADALLELAGALGLPWSAAAPGDAPPAFVAATRSGDWHMLGSPPLPRKRAFGAALTIGVPNHLGMIVYGAPLLGVAATDAAVVAFSEVEAGSVTYFGACTAIAPLAGGVQAESELLAAVLQLQRRKDQKLPPSAAAATAAIATAVAASTAAAAATETSSSSSSSSAASASSHFAVPAPPLAAELSGSKRARDDEAAPELAAAPPARASKLMRMQEEDDEGGEEDEEDAADADDDLCGALREDAKRPSAKPWLRTAARYVTDILAASARGGGGGGGGGASAAAAGAAPSVSSAVTAASVLSALAPLFEPSEAVAERARAAAALAELREHANEVARLVSERLPRSCFFLCAPSRLSPPPPHHHHQAAVAGSQWYWQSPPGTRRCQYAVRCRHLMAGACRFWHTTGETDLVAATASFEAERAAHEAVWGPLEDAGDDTASSVAASSVLHIYRGGGGGGSGGGRGSSVFGDSGSVMGSSSVAGGSPMPRLSAAAARLWSATARGGGGGGGSGGGTPMAASRLRSDSESMASQGAGSAAF